MDNSALLGQSLVRRVRIVLFDAFVRLRLCVDRVSACLQGGALSVVQPPQHFNGLFVNNFFERNL
jgi:hypothetical protein